jgi:hypothetical protein
MLYGLQPVRFLMDQLTHVVDQVIRADPVRGFAVWGDVDDRGAPPENHGWRLSTDPAVGTPVLFIGPVPEDWTHFEVVSLARVHAEGRLRTCAWSRPMTNGRDELFNNALTWFDETAAPTMSAAEAETTRARIFDREKWDSEWGVGPE